MKIVICGSMTFSNEMIRAAELLEKRGHKTVLPHHIKQYAEMKSAREVHEASAKMKIAYDLISAYYEEIKNSDAVLIANYEKHGISNYIGGNSFMEMGFAHVLHKKIFIVNGMPNMIYNDEIIAMKPTILEGDFTKIE
jgi:hypothetical protein